MTERHALARKWGSIVRVGMAAFALLSVLLTAVGGCLDFTPITRLSSNGADDGGAGDGGVSTSARCLACGEKDDDAGGCAAELARCNEVSSCGATIDCVLAGCFDPNVNVGTCLVACEAKGGLTNDGGAASTVFAAALQCMATHCESTCIP